MTTPSSSPGRASGAIVKIDATSGSPQAIYFQYNPATVSRTLQPSMVGGQPGGHSEAVRFTGAPVETFSLEIELDAFDNLASPAQTQSAPSNGIYPALYALETLMYPPVAAVQQATSQLSQGTLDVAPIQAPSVLLVWGDNRVVPITLVSYSVNEQAFDLDLNPLRATISLSARVLSYSDIIAGSPGYSRFMTYQKGKEQFGASAYGAITLPGAGS